MLGVLEEPEEYELALELKETTGNIQSRIFLPTVAFQPDELKENILAFRIGLHKLVNCVGV